MAFNASGVYQRLYNWVADRDAGINITASRMDAETDGIVQGINQLVDGTQPLKAPVRGSYGTAATPGHSFDGDTDTGMYRPAADQIGHATNGVQRTLLSNSAYQINVPLTGTAVTSSATDTTAGRVLRVADFGLGGDCASITASQLDGLTGTGSYRLSDNGPENLFAGSLVQHFNGSGTTALQFGYRPASDGRIIYRRKASGTWSAWTRLDAEYGSGPNGAWVRLSDGTQMCWHRMTASGSADETWTFPAAFSTATGLAVHVTPNSGLNAVFGGARIPTATSCAFNIWTTGGARNAATASLFAIGRY